MIRYALLLSLFGCAGSPMAEETLPKNNTAPDIVLITLDTTRADRIGAYGDPLARTPALDQFAKKGALFREAYTTVPLTLPAHASIMTGLYPSEHLVRDNAAGTLNASFTTLAEHAKQQGYATGAFIGSYVLDHSRGLGQGFDEYFDNFHPQDIAKASQVSDVERPAREVVQQALTWWDKTDGPRFAWIHLFDAHRPYTAPFGWEGDPYRGELFAMDRALQPLLASMTDNTGIVVVADHGENLWDEGELEHGVLLSRSVLRVPLLIRPPNGVKEGAPVSPKPAPVRPEHWSVVPGIGPDTFDLTPVPDAPKAARVIESPVSVVDLFPTVSAWFGQPCSECAGRDLNPAMAGTELVNTPVYAETLYPHRHFGWSPIFVSLDADTILRESDAQHTYSLATDPYWTTELDLPTPPRLVNQIETLKGNWSELAPAVDEQTRIQLEQLGYATHTVQANPGPLVDPATKIGVLNQLYLAQGMMKSKPEAAKKILLSIVAKEPNLIDAQFNLASIAVAGKEGPTALLHLDAVLKTAPNHTQALELKAFVLRNLKRFSESEVLLKQLMQLHPNEARWIHLLVDIYGQQKNFIAIRDTCRTAITQHEEDPFLHYMLGLALIQLEAPNQAITALNNAERHGTRAKDIALWQGRAHELMGNTDLAIEAYYKDAKNRPTDVRPVGAAGRLLADKNKCNEALPFLLKAIERGMKDPDTLRAYRTCGGQGF